MRRSRRRNGCHQVNRDPFTSSPAISPTHMNEEAENGHKPDCIICQRKEPPTDRSSPRSFLLFSSSPSSSSFALPIFCNDFGLPFDISFGYGCLSASSKHTIPIGHQLNSIHFFFQRRINNNNNNNHNNNGQTGSKQQNRPSASSTSGLSGTSGGSHGKKRKRVATVAQRRAANIRERRRMFNLNEAFDKLRRKVPTFAYEKRLSRIETLRLAITYISFMDQVVRNETKASSSTSAAAGGGNGGVGGVGSGATTNNPTPSSAAMAVIHHHHHHHHPHQAEAMEDDADMESYGHRQSSPW